MEPSWQTVVLEGYPHRTLTLRSWPIGPDFLQIGILADIPKMAILGMSDLGYPSRDPGISCPCVWNPGCPIWGTPDEILGFHVPAYGIRDVRSGTLQDHPSWDTLQDHPS